ncbi:MAG TPA: acyl-CoA synthetase [Paraburkholderia sp.]|jgi:predicted LPLAT superfamily acyltransferase
MNLNGWAQRKELGNVAVLRAIAWLSLRFGRPAGRTVLRVAAVYFTLCSPHTRRVSRDYLRRALGRPATLRDIYRHLFTFGATIHDRLYLMNDRFDLFDFRVRGETLVDEALAGGRGAFLFGAHLGSFEAMRAIGRTQPHLRVAVTMYENNARNINAILAAVNPAAKPDVIGLGRVDAMLKVSEALDRNTMIGILADRTLLRDAGASTQRVNFLGAPAAFPLGPLHMAAMLRRPVIFMTALYRGGNRYDIHFEKLADFTDVPRDARASEVQAALARYVALVERHCVAAPYNWFNFFDFWQDAEASRRELTPARASHPARETSDA